MTALETGVIETRIPARLDRLPWSRFHWRIILGLGTAWVLDGLEVTIVGAISSRLEQHGSGITINAAQIGLASAIYIVGACSGALFFGYLTDRYGRKRLFMLTLGLYIAATAVTALSFAPWFFYVFRFFTGAGIGGEYAAINSAIDELIPARARGRVDLAINGSYWIGSAVGSALALFFLDAAIFPLDVGWRLTFAIGVVLALSVLVVRRHVPESPRWLFIHGREEEAERLVGGIEAEVAEQTGQALPDADRSLRVRQREAIGFGTIVRTAFVAYPRRSVLALALFVGQAFLYNGVTFNLGDLMSKFFAVASGVVPLFTIVYALSNFAGPVSIGRLFDTVGRKPMIAATYLGSAAVTVVLYVLFTDPGVLGAWTFIVIVMAVFFLASSGASAAYLTASEIFPMETRALAIAFFYAVGTAVGGVTGPLLFGTLINTGRRDAVGIAFLIGAAVMAVGGIVELAWGVRAEGMQLEDIATPLTVADAEQGNHTAPGSPAGSERLAGRRSRAAADEERARAAEHEAAAQELLADSGAADERVGLERTLAAIAERRARALDEEAAAHEARADAEGEADAHRRAAGRHRAEAAHQRSDAYRNEALALEADEEQTERLLHLADAEHERARAAEQRALAAAALAPGDAADSPHSDDRDGATTDPSDGVREARSAMHGAWAAVHDRRALAHDRRAAGDGAGAERANDEAGGLRHLAEAAGYRLEAAQRRAEAEAQRIEEHSAQEEARRATERRAREDADARARAALERRRTAARSGFRRYRPGPGRGLSATPAISTWPAEPSYDREIQAIERAIAEHGTVERTELAALVGARYWGPGVFSDAVRIAIEDGRIRRSSRSTYELADAIRSEADRDGTTAGGTPTAR